MTPAAPIVVSTIGMPSLFPMRHDDLESHRADRLFSPCRPVAQPTSRGRTDSPNRGSGNCSNCRIRRHHCRRSSKQLSSLTRCDLFSVSYSGVPSLGRATFGELPAHGDNFSIVFNHDSSNALFTKMIMNKEVLWTADEFRDALQHSPARSSGHSLGADLHSAVERTDYDRWRNNGLLPKTNRCGAPAIRKPSPPGSSDRRWRDRRDHSAEHSDARPWD